MGFLGNMIEFGIFCKLFNTDFGKKKNNNKKK